MRRRFLRAWICIAVFCGGAQAADKFPWEADAFSSSPAETLRAAAQLPPPADEEVDVLLDETKFEFDASRRVRKTHRRLYRLLTKEAIDDWSVIEAAWSPWHEERPRIQARVISTDGLQHLLDAGTISEAPVEQSGQIFRDRRRLVAPLPAVEVGAVVEWQVTTADHRAFCDAGSFEEHFFYASNAIRGMRLIVESPEQGPPLHYRVRGIDLTPKRSVENGLVRLEFGPIAVGTSNRVERFLPSDMPFVPHAVIGNGSAWQDVARHYAQIVDRQIGDASHVDLAREMAGDEPSRVAMVQKLLNAVQQRIRYVGIEFGESSIVPHSPPETLKVRYGDCKDQSTLLVALLRSLGHAAHVALLRAGRREDLLPDVPALNAFDHAIVYVPGDPPLWIDPTVPLLRVGELPPSDMGRLALIASPATTGLVRTPEPRSEENIVIRTLELTLARGDDGRVRHTSDYHGVYENEVRSYYADSKPEDLRGELKQTLQERYGVDCLTEFKYGDPRDLTVPFQAGYQAEGINHGVSAPSFNFSLAPEWLLDDIPWPLQQHARQSSPADDKPKDRWERAAPFQFPRPFLKEMRYRLMLPIGFVAAKLPDSFSKQFGPATVSADFARGTDNMIEATFRLDTGNGRFTSDEAKALRAFLGQLRDGKDGGWLVDINLEHSAEQHIAQERIREGLAEYQQLVARHPADIETRRWYVESLVSAGMGAAAREEALRATESDANSSQAWQALGYARMHDDFGRFMEPKSDPFAAEAALRKAVEIDPDDHVARWNLALALEHGSGPRRYAPGPRLNEAAEQYRALRAKKYHEPNLATNLLLTLSYADNWQDVVRLAGELEPFVLRNAMWVAAAAVTADIEAAKAKAAELAKSDDDRRNLLLHASDVLNNTRQYAASAALAECALPLIADADERERIQGFAASVKALHRMDGALLPKEDPRRLVQQLHVAAFSAAAPESVSSLFVSEATAADAGAALRAIRARYASAIRTLQKGDKTSERIADVTSLLKLASEGDADTGFRVVAENVHWYVVRQNGDLRLLPPSLGSEQLGRQALRRLESDDEVGARRWLAWAAADLPLPAGFFVDPFSASPFSFLWKSLKHKHLKIAAAVLAAPGDKSDEAMRLLLEFQKTATLAPQLLQLDRALARTFTRRNDWQRLLELAERVQSNHSWAEEPRDWKLLALKGLNRANEAHELESQRLSKMTGDERTWAEGFWAAKRGDFDLSQKLLRPLADNPSKTAAPIVFNELAWNALFREEAPTEAALADAVKANERTNYQIPGYLHTLATVHAELTHATEARRFLMQAIDARGGEAESVDLYVLGRIAECFGFDEIAARHYAQVEPDEDANSAYNLAQRRLKRLSGHHH